MAVRPTENLSVDLLRDALLALVLSPRRTTPITITEAVSAIANTPNPEGYSLFPDSVIAQISAAAETPMSTTTVKTSSTALPRVPTDNEIRRTMAEKRLALASVRYEPPRKKSCNRE